MFTQHATLRLTTSRLSRVMSTNMESTFERLFSAAQSKDPSVKGNSDLARLVNELPQTITNWQKRGVPKAKLTDLARSLNVHAEWLASGTGPMKTDAVSEPVYHSAPSETHPPSVDDLLNLLSQRLNETDESTKSSVGQMLLKYSENPDPNSRIANAIKALLDDKDK
ncbi:hypothetical protein HQ393_04995 [Chitinibacter bivalviorum]|uniref:Uncharacterized protein n=1 Tax=Chitinibacter bivalviorum TaxID=2739434 RepID=A0A7H9BI94_9NEIS|nr:hypothetical protein [Chitinibacter bivalviorum]QLG87661.1 hypothetical protein HQ393_04995 [Chitinibacter bivalviorum]